MIYENSKLELMKKLIKRLQKLRNMQPLRRSEPLDKGSLQQKMRFNPDSIPVENKRIIKEWTTGAHPEAREAMMQTPMDENARKRALLNLNKQTKVRINKNGEREFLLHRGMGEGELFDGNNKHSSWTPHYDIAENFAQSYQNSKSPIVTSSWIKESDIKHIPLQYGNPGVTRGHAGYHGEHEVIVDPNYQAEQANPDEVKQYIQAKKTPWIPHQRQKPPINIG